MTYAGQWLGAAEGENPGLVILDIEYLDGQYVGNFYHHDDDPELPGTTGYMQSGSLEFPISFTSSVSPFLPLTGEVLDVETFRDRFPEILFGSEISASLEIVGDGMRVEWQTSAGYAGGCQSAPL